MTDTAQPMPRIAPRMTPPWLAFLAAVAAPALVSVVLSAAVAAISRRAGVSHHFTALDLATYTPLIVLGLLAGAIGWTAIRRRSQDPARLLRWLAPTVVFLSLTPDIIVGASHTLIGSSWGGVIALMVMHVIVAASGVVSFATLLPLLAAHPER